MVRQHCLISISADGYCLFRVLTHDTNDKIHPELTFNIRTTLFLMMIMNEMSFKYTHVIREDSLFLMLSQILAEWKVISLMVLYLNYCLWLLHTHLFLKSMKMEIWEDLLKIMSEVQRGNRLSFSGNFLSGYYGVLHLIDDIDILNNEENASGKKSNLCVNDSNIKNLVCNNHTTSITSYYTDFKFCEVHFSLLSLTEDSFSQSEVLS